MSAMVVDTKREVGVWGYLLKVVILMSRVVVSVSASTRDNKHIVVVVCVRTLLAGHCVGQSLVLQCMSIGETRYPSTSLCLHGAATSRPNQFDLRAALDSS